MRDHYDVVIIGGGINGCGCAHDAALRGLSVLLCEKDDLASKTSSSSTKLIHGGLRYLEQYHFNLVKKAIKERQTLLSLAPHLVHPLPIVLPYQPQMRPIWLLRLGLFFYDYLSKYNQLPKSKWINRTKAPTYFASLQDNITQGFLFYDALTDDARLTLANAIEAKNHGATILTRSEVIQARAENKLWYLTIQPKNQPSFEVRAKVVVNASGPWVASTNKLFNQSLAHDMSFIKGSHLVVHQLYVGDHAYLLQHDDHRVVFVIPYHGHTLIGTTDVAYQGSLNDVGIDSKEVDYLCNLIQHYFNKRLSPADIIHSWSGIRPLLKEKGKRPSELSRDYVYRMTYESAPLMTIYSGKITTYRQLAKEVVDEFQTLFADLPDSKTKQNPLPGATLGNMALGDYHKHAYEKYHWLNDDLLNRYLNNYGTRTEMILAGCNNIQDLGICFANELYQKEVDYLCEHEWACDVDDIIWRRTKLGLSMDVNAQQHLSDYLFSKRHT